MLGYQGHAGNHRTEPHSASNTDALRRIGDLIRGAQKQGLPQHHNNGYGAQPPLAARKTSNVESDNQQHERQGPGYNLTPLRAWSLSRAQEQEQPDNDPPSQQTVGNGQPTQSAKYGILAQMQQIVKDGEKLKMALEVLEKERGFYQNQFFMFAQGSSGSEDVGQQATLRQHVDQRAAQIGRDIAEKQASLESMKDRYNLLQALAGKLGDFQQDLPTSA